MCDYDGSGDRYMRCMQREWAEDKHDIQSGMKTVSLMVVAQ